MTTDDEDLYAAARAWIDRDPDPTTRRQLDELLTLGDVAALRRALGAPLAFGTAGLRGPRGPGPSQMNRAVVRDAVAAIAVQLLGEHDGHRIVAVVGRDARHGSAGLEAQAIEVLSGHGIDVAAFGDVVPTPLLAFAVRHLGAHAGLMFTASHNPASDDGMKVYWSDGAQIIAPLDVEIEERIRRIRSTAGHDVAAGIEGVRPGRLVELGTVDGDSPVVDAYLSHVRTTRLGGATPTGRPAPTVRYTALHGVGAELFEKVALEAGIRALAVTSQRAPDPDFPGVSSPNPEEHGVLDALLAEVTNDAVDLGVALDPDADRLALVVPGRGGWRQLTGDETGALLAHHLLEASTGRPDRFVASTVVTSRLVARMCAAADVRHVETLTGFKWLCRPGLQHPEWSQVLLHEEALGYAVGPSDRDKDGISAAVCATDAIDSLAAVGRSVDDLFDDLARRHGAFVTLNDSVRLPEGVVAGDMLPDTPPTGLGGIELVHTDRPAPDVHRWYLADDTRVVLRPSGTEPKLKYYCEGIGAVDPSASPSAVRRDVLERLRLVTVDIEALIARLLAH